MSVPSVPVSSAETTALSNSDATTSVRGRWKFAAAILLIAGVAQAILWARTWEDPTNFKMSILFVWPAAIFSLLIWWTFFSGWSALVRFGAVATGFAGVVAFFSIFRVERFDGDMVPTRISFRWTPSFDQKTREYLDQLKSVPADKSAGNTEHPENVAEQAMIADDNDWPGFRGPARDGIIRNAKLRTDWEARPPKQLWRHPVGRGWSSFAVIGDLAFTQEQRDDSEAIVAYRLSDGQQVWTHLDQARVPVPDVQGGTGPRATPQFDEGKLYTLGATGILNCLNAKSGKLIWTKNILEDAGTPEKPVANLVWGMAGSPLIVDNLVIVIPGGSSGASVAAYEKESGKKVWANGKHPATYAGACLDMLEGQRVLLTPLGDGLAAHSLTTGEELWFSKWTNPPLVCGAMPVVVSENSVLYGIGYGEGTVRLDVHDDGKAWSVKEKWRSNRFRPKFNDFVIRDGHAYGLDDGTLTCMEVESGKIKWKSGRYGYGQVLMVDDLLLIVSEKGTAVLVPAQPVKPSELASFQVLDAEAITWNQPVLVRGKLLVRNTFEAACYDLE